MMASIYNDAVVLCQRVRKLTFHSIDRHRPIVCGILNSVQVPLLSCQPGLLCIP